MLNAAPSSLPPAESPAPRARTLRIASARPLDEESLATVRRLIAEHGLQDAAKLLETAKNTVAAAASGADLREGTRMLFDERLRRLASR